MAEQKDHLRIPESLEGLDAALRGGILRIHGENSSQLVEWQAVEGMFSHDKITIQRRLVGSSWNDATVGDVLAELRKGGAVALWLRRYTRAHVSFESLSLLEPNEDAHLKMLPDDLDETFGPVEDRAEEILEAKYELVEGIDYARRDLMDAACTAFVDLQEKLSGADLVESAAQQAVADVLRYVERTGSK
jgi:hypothetical protein